MEPQEAYKFCQYCGGNYEVVDKAHFVCTQCGKHHFVSPSVGVGGICLNSKNQILLVKRGINPHKGMWGMPAGFVDIDDLTAEEGLRREFREEVGIEIEDVKYYGSSKNIYPFQGLNRPHLSLYFTCKCPDSAEPQASDDASEVKWFDLKDIPFDDIGFKATQKTLETFVSQFKS